MDEMTLVDITQFSFDEFITFMFQRKVQDKTKKWDPWYWHTNVVFDPQRICTYYLRLFNASGLLLERFSRAQIEEGFWAILSPGNLECSVHDLIWNTDLPLENREECVRSMFFVYRDLFSIDPLETATYMWWDTLCWDLWHRGKRDRLRGGEDLSMQDVIFATLVEILALDSEDCQIAALHGLGHLHHPATGEAIQNYLVRYPSLSDKRREYALAAARFEVQ
jgi:hypothetical protein